jgi:hypothetical protein
MRSIVGGRIKRDEMKRLKGIAIDSLAWLPLPLPANA